MIDNRQKEHTFCTGIKPYNNKNEPPTNVRCSNLHLSAVNRVQPTEPGLSWTVCRMLLLYVQRNRHLN